MPPTTVKSKKQNNSHKADGKFKADKPLASKKIKKDDKDSNDTTKTNLNQSSNSNPKVERKKRQAKPQKSEPTTNGYTPDQLEKYKALIKEIGNKYSNDEMKNILRRNDQKITGNKRELAERIADGELLGKIPRCPACFGGRLQFDFKKGIYKCPGYYEDDHFLRCKAAFDANFIQREQWVE